MFQGMKQYFKLGLLLILFLPIFVNAAALHPARVGFFSGDNNGVVTRIAIGVWTRAADLMQYPFVLSKLPTQAKALEALRENKLDVVVGPLLLNKKDSTLYYANSYIHDSAGIIIPNDSHVSFMATLEGYFEALFGITVATIVVIIVIFGVVIWFFERKKNSEMYAREPVKGIADSIWTCLVTFSTVGYGDIVPRSAMGRVITGVWIVISLFMVSAFLASITSELTYMKSKRDQLTNLGQLYDKRVGFIQKGPGITHIVDQYHLNPVYYATIQALFNAVSTKKIAAGMANIYQLRASISQREFPKVIMTHYELQRGNYAFAMQNTNPRKAELLRVLYTLSETGGIKMIINNIVGPLRVPKKG